MLYIFTIDADIFTRVSINVYVFSIYPQVPGTPLMTRQVTPTAIIRQGSPTASSTATTTLQRPPVQVRTKHHRNLSHLKCSPICALKRICVVVIILCFYTPPLLACQQASSVSTVLSVPAGTAQRTVTAATGTTVTPTTVGGCTNLALAQRHAGSQRKKPSVAFSFMPEGL